MENRIRQYRLLAGLSQAELAKIVGVNTPQVSKWENGLVNIPSARMVKIADALGVKPYQLFVSEEYPDETTDTIGHLEPNAVPVHYEGPSYERMREDLPVFGTALGAPRDFDGKAIEQTTLNQGEILYYAKRPVALNERVDAYGLHVQGESMSPVHLEGDLILVERKRPPRIGDDVVVYLRDVDEDDGARARAVLIKRLVRRTASHVELQQFNPPLTFTVATEDFVRFDRVMRLGDFLS